MGNILLVEPDYRSKFPPLGLMRISTFHRKKGDCVTFVRGTAAEIRELAWHRIYVSSLFTWELPRTVKTIRFYQGSVETPKDLYVGGIGASLCPDYIRDRVQCQVVPGPLDKPDMLGRHRRVVADCVPDYDLIKGSAYAYKPVDSYFCRATVGCVRNCRFCAVPTLEPRFQECRPLKRQIAEIDKRYGAMQNLVILDNNILASASLSRTVADAMDAGFERGSKRNGRQRAVDFNQGIDARLITPAIADQITQLSLDPVRLAFDTRAMERPYRKAVKALAKRGVVEFTNYMLFNFDDTPEDLYYRMRVNLELSDDIGIRVTGFPMRYIPIRDIDRQHVAPGWRWRQLRGLQCILHATRGLVSPNTPFFERAFGRDCEEFLEILALPDHYIMFRNHYEKHEARRFRQRFRRLADTSRQELLGVLAEIHFSADRKREMSRLKRFKWFAEQHYPDGRVPRRPPSPRGQR
ncbi:MAG: cobalamin-binding domain-containing protein [Candidatus Hydrogenedentes bacterium]|nr:cobalamin-binding domain-containing protein [Candidatus Hydrogenedentota bacterium]